MTWILLPRLSRAQLSASPEVRSDEPSSTTSSTDVGMRVSRPQVDPGAGYVRRAATPDLSDSCTKRVSYPFQLEPGTAKIKHYRVTLILRKVGGDAQRRAAARATVAKPYPGYRRHIHGPNTRRHRLKLVGRAGCSSAPNLWNETENKTHP
jgi:hypothetical protein